MDAYLVGLLPIMVFGSTFSNALHLDVQLFSQKKNCVYYPALSCVLFYICEMYFLHRRASTIFHKSYIYSGYHLQIHMESSAQHLGIFKTLITMLLFYLCHLLHFKRDFLLILISCILEYVRSCCILSIRPMMRLFFLSILHEIGSLANSWRVRVQFRSL